MIRVFSFGCLVLAGFVLAPAFALGAKADTSELVAQLAAPAGSPVAINGKLRVCGTKLCNRHNKPIQLRGMSTHGLQWFSQCINEKSLNALAEDWRADVVRVSTYVQEGGYETDPKRFADLVNSVVDMATARGLYVIVDWHILTPGDPYYNLHRAKTFFADVARAHADKGNILYEVANEPNGVGWPLIKSYHEEIIPVIRNRDRDAIVLLGTRAWSSLGISDGSSEQEIIDDPVDAKNVMYTMHFYAGSHRDAYLDALERASRKLPIFVTEFGTQQFTGDGANDFEMSQRYIHLMRREKISWTNWNFSDDQRSGGVFKPGTCPDGQFAGTSRLKPAGEWIRQRIRSADEFPGR